MDCRPYAKRRRHFFKRNRSKAKRKVHDQQDDKMLRICAESILQCDTKVPGDKQQC